MSKHALTNRGQWGRHSGGDKEDEASPGGPGVQRPDWWGLYRGRGLEWHQHGSQVRGQKSSHALERSRSQVLDMEWFVHTYTFRMTCVTETMNPKEKRNWCSQRTVNWWPWWM